MHHNQKEMNPLHQAEYRDQSIRTCAAAYGRLNNWSKQCDATIALIEVEQRKLIAKLSAKEGSKSVLERYQFSLHTNAIMKDIISEQKKVLRTESATTEACSTAIAIANEMITFDSVKLQAEYKLGASRLITDVILRAYEPQTSVITKAASIPPVVQTHSEVSAVATVPERKEFEDQLNTEMAEMDQVILETWQDKLRNGRNWLSTMRGATWNAVAIRRRVPAIVSQRWARHIYMNRVSSIELFGGSIETIFNDVIGDVVFIERKEETLCFVIRLAEFASGVGHTINAYIEDCDIVEVNEPCHSAHQAPIYAVSIKQYHRVRGSIVWNTSKCEWVYTNMRLMNGNHIFLMWFPCALCMRLHSRISYRGKTKENNHNTEGWVECHEHGLRHRVKCRVPRSMQSAANDGTECVEFLSLLNLQNNDPKSDSILMDID